ncbi:TPA: hypothetical protein ACH3X1_002505 [Trebouxia sp. C0004]
MQGLVREYLTRNSLIGTLRAFDSERPRGPGSVASRSALRKGLGLERLPAKVNKSQGTATLELWVLYQQLKLEAAIVGQEHSALSNNSCTTAHVPEQTTQPQNLLSHFHAAQDCNAEQLAQDQAEATHIMPAAIFPRAGAQSVLNSAGSCSQEAAQVSQGHKQEVSRPAAQPTLLQLQHHSDLIVQDLENELLDLGIADRASSLGSCTRSQRSSDITQGSKQYHTMQLPITRHEAHVFAAVMAMHQPDSSSPSAQQQRDVLAAALTSAVWQASDSNSASVVCCKQASTSGLTFDQLCQSAAQLPCKSRAEVEAAFQSQLWQFQEPHSYGLLLLLFSLLLTHGVRQTKADMDEPDTCLIAAHGYCSQDLVNLVLTGHAVTNCFNGKKDVAGKVCQGVQQRSRLGFLSLFEWFGYTQVGR